VWSQAQTREGESDLLASALALAASLRKGEERFRRLIEAAPSALVMINQAGQIEMVNVQTERLFGYTRSELLGAPVKKLLPATLPPVPRVEGLSTGFAEPSSRPMAEDEGVYGVKKNGSQIPVEVGLSPIETDEGMMVLAAIVDISRRVRLEAEIRQTLKMHAIGRVTAGVAHDFNNLLQTLVGSLEVLLEIVADQPEAVEWGEMALQATTRGRELTDRLLSFSRKQVLTASPILIDALFCGLKQLINHLFETNTKARTELVMVRCAPDLAALADHAQLETALINLAVNARDAIALGGCLRISAFEADADPDILPPGRYTVISVVDTGTGMDADTLAQAFDPFFTTKGHNGTGLGLSMVQGFARQSGGDVYITSVIGEGTTIELWLPSASAPSEVKNLVAAPLPMTGRILVVDDTPDVLRLVSTFLRRSGLEVTGKANGDLALAELAVGSRFDVIVTDFAMPGMNGLELLTRACAIDQSMSGMIITGFSDPELLSELNHFVVLRKPFNRAELIQTVLRVMGAKRDDHCEELDPRCALPVADA
jgi:PAS domain S-box-containing protein